MPQQDPPVLTLSAVEAMLSQRQRTHDEEVCPDLMTLALVYEGIADNRERRRAAAHLSRCAVCAETSLRMGEMLADGSITPLPRPSYLKTLWQQIPWPQVDRRQRTWFLPALAVPVAAAVFIMVSPLNHREEANVEGLAPKGELDRIQVAIQRGQNAFTAPPGSTLQEGDLMGIFYFASQDGYLAVLNVDEIGEVNVLSPSKGQFSTPVSEGQEVPLSDGGYVSAAFGCEWVVAAFSDHPLRLEDLKEALRQAHRDATDCSLDATLPGTRTTNILNFIRDSE